MRYHSVPLHGTVGRWSVFYEPREKRRKKGKNNFRLFSFLSQGFWGIPEFDGLLRRWRIAGVEGRWVAYSIRISVGGQLAIRAAPVTVCTG